MSDLKQKYDASMVAVMRQALNEVVTDRRFLARKSVTPLEVAEHTSLNWPSGRPYAFDRLEQAVAGRAGLQVSAN
jgi:hypothetical protein